MPKIQTHELLARASAKHENRYTYGKMEKHPKGRGQMFTVICKEHGEFLQEVAAHLSGKGCKKCAVAKGSEAQRLSIAEIASRASSLGYTYTYVSTDYSKKTCANPTVTYTCDKHGEQTQDLYNHLAGKGCKPCSYERKRSTLEYSIAKAIEVHNGKYSYTCDSWDSSGRTGSNILTVTCPEHGMFEQTVQGHLSGYGCSRCGEDLKSAKTTLSDSEILEAMSKVDEYKPLAVIRSPEFSGYKVVSSCEKHGEFTQFGYNRVKGQRCPSCSTLISKASTELYNTLTAKGFEVQHEYAVVAKSKFKWDLAIPSKNLAIEFHGIYWHSEEYKDAKYHKIKHDMALSEGFRTIHIFDDEWEQKRDLVTRAILQALGSSDATKVSARGCDVRSVTASEARVFLDANHIQGFSSAGSYFGLVDKVLGLVAVAAIAMRSRGRNGRKSEVDAELVRYATSASVRGGLSKLLKNSQSILEYKTLTTFSDIRFFSGDSYAKVGFVKIAELKPDYFYSKSGKRVHKSNLQKSRFRLLAASGKALYDKDLTESQLALLNGYKRVYDCGKFVWQVTYK